MAVLFVDNPRVGNDWVARGVDHGNRVLIAAHRTVRGVRVSAMELRRRYAIAVEFVGRHLSVVVDRTRRLERDADGLRWESEAISGGLDTPVDLMVFTRDDHAWHR